MRAIWQKAVERLSRRAMPPDGEHGQGLAEYALILALVALACVAALGALGSTIVDSPGFKIFDAIS